MRYFNSILKKCIVLLFLLSGLSCNDWLDVMPSNQQTMDMFWESEEELFGVLMSTYRQVRTCQEKFVQWGELRGDGISLGASATNNEQKIKSLQILPDNSIADWSGIYTAIGRANSVLKYGSLVQERDPTLSQEVLNSYYAEAIFLRSLCYFYLVRTFGEVPLILEPYVDDSQDYAIPKSTEEEVLTQIITDLYNYVERCKPGYEEGDYEWQNRGRATRWAYYALMADIELWRENYDAVIAACEAIYESGRFELVSAENWYTLFYPGNTNEEIFELEYNNSLYSQGSSLWSWFYNDGGNVRYVLGPKATALFEDEEITETDRRGANATYHPATMNIWKYGGTGYFGVGVSRPSNERDGNWIFYRLADIKLMEAEAWAMKGGEDNYLKAYDIVTEIRRRANLTVPLGAPEGEMETLEMILNERVMEFVGEGKRWFDILRMAKKENYKYKQYLINVLLDGISAKDRPIYNSKLSDVNSYYFPIYQDDIEAGKGILVQNPYYDN